MDKKYLINEDTLNSIAQAIRIQENSGETIATTDFAKRIEAIEPLIEEYMKITDFLDYPIPLDENDYTEDKIARCAELYKFYLEMEDIT